MTANTTRAIGIARVSTKEQAAPEKESLPYQSRRFAEHRAEQDPAWQLVGVELDDVSRGDYSRPGLTRAMARRRRKEAGIFLFTVLDRMARDQSVAGWIALKADGLVVRTVYPQIPPKVEYRLTEWGQELCPALDALLHWVEVRSTVERESELYAAP